jgi:flagellar biosynthetic protein FlhB
MADAALDKSQPATPHRRQQARDAGQVAQSVDLASAALLIAGLLALLMLGGQLVDFFGRMARYQLGGESWLEADANFIFSHVNSVLWELAQSLAPILGLLLLVAVLARVLQTGFLWSPERLAPDIDRINPLSGLGRLFSTASAMRLSMGLFKIFLVSLVAFWSLYHRREQILAVATLDLPQIAAFVVDIIIWTSLKIGFALLGLGVVDYAYQRWRHEQNLRMTPQEVREEMKSLQGDPQITARRRQLQRQMAASRGVATIEQADLVVTSSAGLAVAIKYDPATMEVPLVLAKSTGSAAARMLRIAQDQQIRHVQNDGLAKTLSAEAEINQPIPESAFATVAELLSATRQPQNEAALA